MLLDSILLGIGGPPPGEGQSPFGGLFLMVSMFAIIYFVMLRPAQAKQKKLETLLGALKPKDRIIINPGIYAEVIAVDEQTPTLLVRLDANTKVRVLKSAVAGLQEQAETETK